MKPSWKLGLRAARVTRLARVALLVTAATVATHSTAAVRVTYLATDLPDSTAGQDLWSYAYTITGPLSAFESINLFFTPSNYGLDIDVSNSDVRLSSLVTPPMVAPDVDGILSVTAVDPLGADSSAQVDVRFIWLAPGTPNAQSFELLDDQFGVVATGLTSAIPEVSSAALFFAGLTLLAPIARRRLGSSTAS